MCTEKEEKIMKTNDEGEIVTNHYYVDDNKHEAIAFSKSDYVAVKQEHPTWKIAGYLSADGKKVIYVAEGQNP